jgi:16S rRNA G966 N2-methylase RsmD
LSAARETVKRIAQSKERLKDVKSMTQPKFEKIDTFILSDPPYGQEGAMIAGMAENIKADNISEARDTEDGAMLVFVEKRTTPASAEFESKRQMTESFYRQKKVGAAQAAFNSWLDSKCQLKGE